MGRIIEDNDLIKVRCVNCNNNITIQREEGFPEAIKVILTNFCPLCDTSDYYEEQFLDSEGNEIFI